MTQNQDPAQTPPQSPVEVETNPDAKTVGMLCHQFGIFTNFIGPLIIWLTRKNKYPFVDKQAKEALNWQITLLIGYLISIPLMFVFIGALTWTACWICNLVFGVLGTTTAAEGIPYRYPFALRLIK